MTRYDEMSDLARALTKLREHTNDFLILCEGENDWALYGPWGVIQGPNLLDMIEEARACSPKETVRPGDRNNFRTVWPNPARRPDENP